MADLLRLPLTDEGIELMRHRAGYSNPTQRSGTRTTPWNTVTTVDGIRHFVNGYGDDNPLYCNPDYAAMTRWGGIIAPPGFVAAGGPNAHRAAPPRPKGDSGDVKPGEEHAAWLRRLGTSIPDDLHQRTRGALRGIQLYASGGDAYYYQPLHLGDYIEDSAGGIHDVALKESEFSGRSAIVTTRSASWNQRGEIAMIGDYWTVHAERRQVTSDNKYAKDEPAFYTDEQMAEIEAAYDAERHRGPDTLFWEDVEAGDALPTMVKGPLLITDEISYYMGWGWGPYGNGANRLGYENRKGMRGFYTRNQYNAWDVLQRVHWDEAHAKEVGVPMMYDISPIRQSWATNFCTNFMGDDAWLFYLHTEWRRFNYVGDTTWFNGTIEKKYIHETAGPAIDIQFEGTSQRGKVNSVCSATILLTSREHGPVILPSPPEDLVHRVAAIRQDAAGRRRTQ